MLGIIRKSKTHFCFGFSFIDSHFFLYLNKPEKKRGCLSLSLLHTHQRREERREGGRDSSFRRMNPHLAAGVAKVGIIQGDLGVRTIC